MVLGNLGCGRMLKQAMHLFFELLEILFFRLFLFLLYARLVAVGGSDADLLWL